MTGSKVWARKAEGLHELAVNRRIERGQRFQAKYGCYQREGEP